ncbi:MAG TPA: hypothetical protein ENK78_00015, partial [Thiothrix sp.]|nr:hypothetical protein [Thiothrix sp.]
MRIRKTRLATQIALALALSTSNSYAGDVEVSLPAATDAFTIDQPAGTELMRVQGNGNVGIGTANPTKTLHIQGTVAIDNTQGSIALKRITPYTSVGHGNGIITGLSPNSKHLGNFGYLNTTTDPNNPQGLFFIQTDSNSNQINETTEHHFNITHAGNIGMGTRNPSDGTANGGQALKLDVEGAIGASTYCDENGENCQTILQLASASADNLGDHIATQNIDLATHKLVGNGGTDGLVIANNGRVGIGTDTPTAKLHVQDGGTAPAYSGGTDKLALISDGNTAMQITAGNTGNSALMFSDPDSRSIGAVDYDHASDSLRFRVNDLIRTVINASGNMGIGTAAPTSLLDIYGSTAAILTLRDGDATVNQPGHSASIHLRDGSNNITGFLGFGTSAESL